VTPDSLSGAVARLVGCSVLLVALAACSTDKTDSTGADQPDESPSTSASTSASPSITASTSAPWVVMDGALSRCGPVPESVAGAPFDYEVLRDPAVGSIPSVSIGRGPTVVILLHQTDGNGLCGWLPFARDLAQAPGVSALAIDLCNYGTASCKKVEAGLYTDADQTDPVAVAIRHAREQLHPRRIVVVGASMGGSVALMSAATLPGIDAAVDLSGPVTWPGMEVVDQGRALEVPVLASTADSEGPDEVQGMREIVANSPAGSTFLPAESGHGYALLNDEDTDSLPMSEELRDWIVALSS